MKAKAATAPTTLLHETGFRFHLCSQGDELLANFFGIALFDLHRQIDAAHPNPRMHSRSRRPHDAMTKKKLKVLSFEDGERIKAALCAAAAARPWRDDGCDEEAPQQLAASLVQAFRLINRACDPSAP